jgi:hypothetical protein
VAVELVLTALIVPKLRDRLAGKLS